MKQNIICRLNTNKKNILTPTPNCKYTYYHIFAVPAYPRRFAIPAFPSATSQSEKGFILTSYWQELFCQTMLKCSKLLLSSKFQEETNKYTHKTNLMDNKKYKLTRPCRDLISVACSVHLSTKSFCSLVYQQWIIV